MSLQAVNYCSNSQMICGNSLQLNFHFNPKFQDLDELLLYFGISILLVFLLYFFIKYIIKKLNFKKWENNKLKKIYLTLKIVLFILFISHYLTISESCSPIPEFNCKIPVLYGS
ncbi:MAG: hypothetical protein Q9M94_04815 [Candidatus Gracilibacteria bacterium]|nr:hypothetical protein [Candidatus Gracilibacteria bacterium]MDQ7023489.1 hypothetical protein [Candidatus Gracilibacteria bacterium]